MGYISQRVQRVEPSATLAMSQKSAELRAAGVDVINLSVGEPDFRTPEHICEAAKKAIDDGFTHYSPVPGFPDLRQAVADKLLHENRLSYQPSQIVVGNGAKQELCNTVLCLLDPGDEAVIPTPAWVSYVQMVKLAGGVPVTVPTTAETGFKITPERLEAAITTRTRLLFINSPSNPTGAVYNAAELEALAAVLDRHPQVTVISDEIYEHICYGAPVRSIAEFGRVGERAVVINGVSKAYAMTGWRIGWMAAPAELAKASTKLQGQYTSGASSVAQKAALAAYTGPQKCVESMRATFQRRRDLVMDLACNVPGWKTLEPQGAFYIFPDVRGCLGTTAPDGTKIATSADYVMYLLTKAGVAAVDGAAFGTPGFMRISFAASSQSLREAMERITDATRRLKGPEA